ncbi:MAG: 3-hydroxyacyl-CoA dehydrogenase NAD-binding domain-containing protein [Burkholderiaceae bacterium]
MIIDYQTDAGGIVTLTIDMPGQAVNTMNAAFQSALADTVARLESERERIAGVILTSGKDSFFAGGDLNELIALRPEQAPECLRMLAANHAVLRRLEKLGRPVVAALNGSALGGGLELALACHHRISLDQPKIQFGFPEVTLGLLPGAGGVIRAVRLLGLQEAMPYLLEGKRLAPQEALDKGFVDALATDRADLMQQAVTWIAAHPDALQPWDRDGYRLPGGAPNSPKMLPLVQIAPAMLREKTRGNYPAPEAILCAMVEGAQVDFDNALAVEARYFTQLASGQVAKNMIGTFFFQMQEIGAGKSRPRDIPKWRASKVGILGAGMMGAGIAWSNASRGVACVLKDVDAERAEHGKTYSAKLLEKRVRQGRMAADKAAATLALIQPTAAAEELSGCDLIIEAVFEQRQLKAQVTQEAEPLLAPDGIMASNTSTLPISGLAQASSDPARFIGLHFFSPVDKMQLVEIIRGAKTSDQTLARAYDYVQQIGKLPIVVNDSRGFFTSRVFGTFVNEGIAMLAEGLEPALIENAALAVGMPVGPLAVQDEVSLTLSLHVFNQTKADFTAEGKTWTAHPATAIVERMVHEFQRAGKAAGAGFYEYPQDMSINGGKKFLWPELRRLFSNEQATIPYQDVRDRMLYIQSIETIRCLEEKVLESVRDANIGSIFGIGFPGWTGGAIQFVNHVGVGKFAERAEQLRQRYGERFAPPALLLDHARRDTPFQ